MAIPEDLYPIGRLIIKGIIAVSNSLGPGFREATYRRALALELREQGLRVGTELAVPVYYRGTRVSTHRLDLLVEDQVVVELKAAVRLTGHDYAQLRSYLKATGLRMGLLVNFAKKKADFRLVTLF